MKSGFGWGMKPTPPFRAHPQSSYRPMRPDKRGCVGMELGGADLLVPLDLLRFDRLTSGKWGVGGLR